MTQNPFLAALGNIFHRGGGMAPAGGAAPRPAPAAPAIDPNGPDPVGAIIAQHPGVAGLDGTPRPHRHGLAGFVQTMGDNAASNLYGDQAAAQRGHVWSDVLTGVGGALTTIGGGGGPGFGAAYQRANQRGMETAADGLGLSPKEAFLAKYAPDVFAKVQAAKVTPQYHPFGDGIATFEDGQMSVSAPHDPTYSDQTARQNVEADLQAAQEAAAQRAAAAAAEADYKERALKETGRHNLATEKAANVRAAKVGGGSAPKGSNPVLDGMHAELVKRGLIK